MKLSSLLSSLDRFRIVSGDAQIEITGVSSNSKNMAVGGLFIAVRGAVCDGAAFISEAVSRGAAAVVVEEGAAVANSAVPLTVVSVPDSRLAQSAIAAAYYAHPAGKLNTIGVTGTNGKTTVTYLIEAILKKINAVPGVIGTVNYRYRSRVCDSTNTTPGAVQLQALLADMVGQGVTHLVMEVSSHALDQGRTAGLDFRSAVFTNLTQDHLDYHKTLEDYFLSKARLFSGLAKNTSAIINNDDPYGRRLPGLSAARVWTYAIDHPADVTAQDIRLGAQQTGFSARFPSRTLALTSPLIGRHNVYNILAAFTWAYSQGIDLGLAAEALRDCSAVPGRLERIASDRPFSVYVDYAHTEDALKNVLSALRQIEHRKILVVFGCGGDRDKSKRPKMGKVAAELSDFAIITNDNPRSEEPLSIIEEIKSGITTANYRVIPERMEAIRSCLAMAGSGDIVLVAGKGHEDYQIIKDTKVHFDDREAVRQCLQSLN